MIEKDCSAAAVGERWIGRGSRARDFVYLYLGTGVGTGLFLNGDLYRGLTANAGEFGQLCAVTLGRIDASGRPELLLECNPGSFLPAEAFAFCRASTKSPDGPSGREGGGEGRARADRPAGHRPRRDRRSFFTEDVAEIYLTEVEHAVNAYPTARRLRRVRVERSVSSSEAVAVGAASTIFHSTFTPRLRRTP